MKKKANSIKAQIIDFVRNSSEPVSNRAIADNLGLDANSVATRTFEMCKEGLMKRKDGDSIGLVRTYVYFMAEGKQEKPADPIKATIPEEAELEAAIEMFVRALAARIFGEVRADIRDRLK